MQCHAPVPRGTRYLLDVERKRRGPSPVPCEAVQLLPSSGGRSDLGSKEEKKSAPRSLSTHPSLQPFDAALTSTTLSAGECKVSGGESKVSRWVGPPRNSHAPRSKFPDWPPFTPLFWSSFRDSSFVSPLWSHGFLRRGYSPCRCLRDGCRVWVCRLRFFGSSCPVSSTIPYLLRHFLATTTAMAKQEITGEELSARAKANGYRRGVHRDKDSL